MQAKSRSRYNVCMDIFTHASQQRMKSEAPLPRVCAHAAWTSSSGRRISSARASAAANAAYSAAPSRPTGCSPSNRSLIAIILWGPPGTGKTTASQTDAWRWLLPSRPSDRSLVASHFETLSAVLAGKADLRVVIDAALERRRLYQKKTVLFVKGVVEVQ